MATSKEEEENEREEENDTIKGTVFSKAWILSLLVKLISTVNPCQSCEEKQDKEINESSKDTQKKETELDERIENDLCLLWDVSATSEVCLFLHEHSIIELITGVIERSTNDRLTEICLGITNNVIISSSPQQLSFDTTNALMMKLISLLSQRDTVTLVELTRLLVTCLSHEKLSKYYLSHFDISNTSILDDLVFILTSSTNSDLLKHTAILLDIVLDKSESLLINWSTSSELVYGICEAIKQCHKVYSIDVICTLMVCLQSFSTVKEGIYTLFQCSNRVFVQIIDFLKLITTQPTCNVYSDNNESSVQGVMAVLSLCVFILTDYPIEGKTLKDRLITDETIMKYLKGISKDEKIHSLIKELTIKLLSIVFNND